MAVFEHAPNNYRQEANRGCQAGCAQTSAKDGDGGAQQDHPGDRRNEPEATGHLPAQEQYSQGDQPQQQGCRSSQGGRNPTRDGCVADLEGGIRCHYGKMVAAAEGSKPGSTIYVDGFLETCEEGDILLKPAFGRDPKASFEPK